MYPYCFFKVSEIEKSMYVTVYPCELGIQQSGTKWDLQYVIRTQITVIDRETSVNKNTGYVYILYLNLVIFA